AGASKVAACLRILCRWVEIEGRIPDHWRHFGHVYKNPPLERVPRDEYPSPESTENQAHGADPEQRIAVHVGNIHAPSSCWPESPVRILVRITLSCMGRWDEFRRKPQKNKNRIRARESGRLGPLFRCHGGSPCREMPLISES